MQSVRAAARVTLNRVPFCNASEKASQGRSQEKGSGEA